MILKGHAVRSGDMKKWVRVDEYGSLIQIMVEGSTYNASSNLTPDEADTLARQLRDLSRRIRKRQETG